MAELSETAYAAGVADILSRLSVPQNQQFVTVGDSRMAYTFAGYASPRSEAQSANSPINLANGLLGHRLTPLANFAIPGKRSDEYLAKLPDALATGAGFIAIFGFFNDLWAGRTSAEIWDGYNGQIGFRAALDLCRAAGRRIITFTETGGGGGANQFDLAKLRETLKINQRLREYASTHSGVILVDAAALCWDPSATTQITHRAGYFDDYVHWNHKANWLLAKNLADQLRPITVPMPSAASAAFEYQSVFMEGINCLRNPLFLTTTGGAALPAGFSGLAPEYWSFSRVGTPTAVLSAAANADGYGNDLVVAATFAAAGDTLVVSQSLVTTHLPIGSIVRAGGEVSVDAGAVNYWGSWMRNEVRNLVQADCHASAFAVASPDDGRTVTHRTAYAVIPDAAGNINFNIRIVGAGAGSATVRIRRPWYRKQFEAL